MADQETTFQIYLLRQMADLADVIHHNRPCNIDQKTDRAHEKMTDEHEQTMIERADDFEQQFGGQ